MKDPPSPIHFCLAPCLQNVFKRRIALTGGGPRINLKVRNLLGGKQKFLIDTGADINLIERKAICPSARIEPPRIRSLIGITEDELPTIGLIHLKILGSHVAFHIVDHDLPVNGTGVLGLEFLIKEKVDIRYLQRNITTAKRPCQPMNWYEERRDGKPITIPPRTRMVIGVPVEDSELKEGYLPRIDTEEGVYLGESIVHVENGLAFTMAINTTEESVDLHLLPQSIEPFEIPEERDPTVAHCCLATAVYPAPGNRSRDILNALPEQNLKPFEKKEVMNLIQDFDDVFHLPGDKLGKAKHFRCKIRTTDDKPVHKRQYKYPPQHRDEINRQIKALEEQEIIRPSESPYNSPLWIVPKKADSQGRKRWRMVIDFRDLNQKTIGDSYPLPDIAEILSQLGEQNTSAYLTSLVVSIRSPWTIRIVRKQPSLDRTGITNMLGCLSDSKTHPLSFKG